MALVNFRSLATQLRVKDHSLSRQTFDIFALTMRSRLLQSFKDMSNSFRKAAASMNSHAALQSITTQIAEIENIFAQELDTKSDTNIQVTEEEKVASVKTDYNTLASAPAGSDLSEAEEKDESHQSDPGISSVFEESGCNHSDADFVDAFSSLDLNDAEAKCEDNNDGGSGGPIVKTSTIQKLKVHLRPIVLSSLIDAQAEDNTILRRAARITICKTRSGQNDLAGVELAFVKYNGWNTHFKRRDSGEVIRLSNQRTIRVAYFE